MRIEAMVDDAEEFLIVEFYNKLASFRLENKKFNLVWLSFEEKKTVKNRLGLHQVWLDSNRSLWDRHSTTESSKGLDHSRGRPRMGPIRRRL